MSGVDLSLSSPPNPATSDFARKTALLLLVEELSVGLPWLLLTILLMVTFSPYFMNSPGLDLSYEWGSTYAFLQHARFGPDFLATFGPWGFDYFNIYHPQVMGWMIAGQSIVAISMFAGAWAIGRNLGFHPLVTGIWLISVVLWGDLLLYDGRCLAMGLLPVLIRQTNPKRRDSMASYIVVVALAIMGLCKFIFFALAAGAIGLLVLEDLYHKRIPLLGIWFVTALLLAWRIAGQAMGDLPIYLVDAWKLSSGYSDAMGAVGPDLWMLPTVILISGLMSFMVLARFWKTDRVSAVIGCFTVAAAMFMCFKEGFVRHDGHELVATSGLATIAFLLLPVFWIRGMHWLRALSIVVVVLSIGTVSKTYSRILPPLTFKGALTEQPAKVWDRLSTGLTWLWKGDQIFDAGYEQGMAVMRATCPLPMVNGSVDMYGVNQLGIIAAGMDYKPRPVTYGLQAWSPAMIAMNRRFLLSDRATENIFFMPEAIDNQFRSLEDGALWPYLMTLYTPAELTTNGFLVMHRSAQPRAFKLTPLSSGTYRLNEHIKVPPISKGAVWMKIKLRKTLMGKLETLVLRSPEVSLDFTKADGHTIRERIIPGMAEDGFVLSPVVTDAMGFLSLMVNQTHLANVTDVSISVGRVALFKNFYDPDIQVTFQKLELPPLSLPDAPDLESLVNLGEMGFTTNFPAGTSTFLGTDGKWDLFSHPPARLQLAVPGGASVIHVSGGIRPAAWDKTAGVVFVVSAIDGDGSSHQLFSRALQPKSQPNDRPQFQADVPLPPGTSRLEFETRAVTTLDYCWAFWSDVRFQKAGGN